MNPKVSVVTVCLNNIGVIRPTMESILNQTYDNIERIVIDGRSTDGTFEYLSSIKEKLTVLISEPDGGIYDAMNKGIEVATGDYIIFINAGDRLRAPDVVKTVMTDADIADSKIIAGRYQYEYGGRITKYIRPIKAGKEGCALPHQAVFVNTTLQKKNLFDTRYRVAGDYELWRRLESKGLFDVRYIDNIISVFSYGGVSSNQKNDPRRYLEGAYIDCLYSNRFGYVDLLKLFGKVTLRRVLYALLGGRLFFKLLRAIKIFEHIKKPRKDSSGKQGERYA